MNYGKEHMSHLKTHATNTKGEGSLMRFQGAGGKGSMARVTC